jgi:hypothetical protein
MHPYVVPASASTTATDGLLWVKGRVNKFGAFCRNSPKFDGFGPVRIQKSPNIVHCFKISEKKIKTSKKYVKKLDRILRLLVKKFL